MSACVCVFTLFSLMEDYCLFFTKWKKIKVNDAKQQQSQIVCSFLLVYKLH